MIRPVEIFLALRYLRRTRSYVSVITVLSLVSVLLSVAVLIVVLSVMSGFEKRLRDKVIGFNAHLIIINHGILFNHEAIRKRVLQDKRVLAVAPFVYGPVLVECGNQISTPFIKGVTAEEGEKVIPMKDHLIAGTLFAGPEEVDVGSEWAARNRAFVGDRILVHAPKNLMQYVRIEHSGKDPTGEPHDYTFPSEYRIAGVFSTGMFEYDANVILMDLSEAQRLYGLDDGVHGLAIRLRDADQAMEVQQDLAKWLQPPEVALTWMDQNHAIFSAIAVEKVSMSFCLLFIMLVAAFGICNTLITLTVQRSREIGVMKALGARNGQIAAIFTLYGLITGVIGAALGVAGGLLALYYRNEFRDWLSHTLGIELFPASVYNFSSIPAEIDWWFVLGVALVGVLLSTLASLIPAVLAALSDPVKALRGE